MSVSINRQYIVVELNICQMVSLRSSIKRINSRQIPIHFLATWLFIKAFKYFSFLYDLRLLKIVGEDHSLNLELSAVKKQKISLTDIVNYTTVTATSWLWGLLLAFMISLVLSLRKRWFWGNSILSFIGVLIICIIPLERKHSEIDPDAIYHNLIPLSVGSCIAIGILCLSVGLWMFFSRKTNDFIDETA